jgi:arylsulfatase A-like enzyme
MADAKKPNILVIWGDDIGMWNLSCYSNGMMGYRTPHIDRLAREGMMFTDAYGEQSCTAGRASFITGQSGYRTGLTKVGIPGAPVGLQAEDPTIAELLKNHGYSTGQFGKNHLGDQNKYLPTVHGFDEFFGNLYHLNAEEEPQMADYPPQKDFPSSASGLGPGECSTAGRRTRTIRPSSRDGVGWASRGSRTRARSPRSGWKSATTSSWAPPRTGSRSSTRRASPSSAGSIPPTCIGSPTPSPPASVKRGAGSPRITTP